MSKMKKSTVFGQDRVVEEICMIMQNHYISENRYYKYSYFKESTMED